MDRDQQLIYEAYRQHMLEEGILDDIKSKAKQLGLSFALIAAVLGYVEHGKMERRAQIDLENKAKELEMTPHDFFGHLGIQPLPPLPDSAADLPPVPGQLPPVGPPPDHTGPPVADNNATNIDWGFIAEQEGAAVRQFYVPNDPDAGNESGVTIASGFDIGQHNVREINNIFAGHTNIINILTPFADTTGQEARNLLTRVRPAALDNDTVREIDDINNTHRAAELEQTFNGASELEFNELPEQHQTVIASVAFQYGINGIQTHNFWGQVTRGQWTEAIANLRNYRDAFGARRNREADLLQQGVDQQTPQNNR